VLWFLGGDTPTPIPPSRVDESLVGPGVWGFAIFAFVAIASILLIIDMVRRTRRVRYRAEIQERLADEAAGRSTPVDRAESD
jgi:hypothetical protein